MINSCILSYNKPYKRIYFLILFFVFYTYSCFAFYDEFIDKHVRDGGNNLLNENIEEASASFALSKAAARKMGVSFTPLKRPIIRRSNSKIISAQLKTLLAKKHSRTSLKEANEIRQHMSGNTDVIDVYITLCLWEIGEEKEANVYSHIHLSEEKASKLHLHMLTKSLEINDFTEASKHLKKINLSKWEYLKWKFAIILISSYCYIFLFIILIFVFVFLMYFKNRHCLNPHAKLQECEEKKLFHEKTIAMQTMPEFSCVENIRSPEIIPDKKKREKQGYETFNIVPIQVLSGYKATKELSDMNEKLLSDVFLKLQLSTCNKMIRFICFSTDQMHELPHKILLEIAEKYSETYSTLIIDATFNGIQLHEKLGVKSLPDNVMNKIKDGAAKTEFSTLCKQNLSITRIEKKFCSLDVYSTLLNNIKKHFDIILVFAPSLNEIDEKFDGELDSKPNIVYIEYTRENGGSNAFANQQINNTKIIGVIKVEEPTMEKKNAN